MGNENKEFISIRISYGIYSIYNIGFIPSGWISLGILHIVKPGKSVLLFFFFLKMSESVILVETVKTKP